MLQHHSSETEDQQKTSQLSINVGSEIQPVRELEFESVDALEVANNSIEDYLDQVIAPLVPLVPRVRREEIRGTVRRRIEDFTAAHMELGSDRTEAVEVAIIQSGDPSILSERWIPQSVTTHVKQTAKTSRLKLIDRLTGSAGSATVAATFLFSIPYLLDATGKAGTWWIAKFGTDVVNGSVVQHEPDNIWVYYRLMLLAVPLVSGLFTGLLCKRKPVRGVVNAITVLTIPAIVLPGFLMGMGYAKILSDTGGLSMPINPFPGLSGLVPWLVLGCAGAGVGSLIRKAGAKLKTRIARKMRLTSRRTSRPGTPFRVLKSNVQGPL